MTDVQQQIDRFLGELDRAWPGRYAAVLFGSAARGQHVPGWSDINVLLVADGLGPADLVAARPALASWRDGAQALPLLFSLAEWRRSADAYPLEIAEMRTAYRVLRGTDPLAGMRVQPADLRAALEREFRGKLMRLRQGFALFAGDAKELTEFVRRSASSLLLLCRGLLVLGGGAVPAEASAVIVAAAAAAGFPPDAMVRIIARRADKAWQCTEADIREYLLAVEQAARYIDNFQTGAQE
jgi:predicted nucleotidyltransferase